MTKLPTARIMPPSTGTYLTGRLGHGEFLVLTKGFWLVRIWFRPRIMRDVTKVDWSTTILGHPSRMPIYIVSGLNIYTSWW